MATLNDIETKIQSIIDILYSRIFKTITGTLPLTFTTKAGNAVDWSISGNDDNGENLFDKDAELNWAGISIGFSSQMISVVAETQYLCTRTSGLCTQLRYYTGESRVGASGWVTSASTVINIPAGTDAVRVEFRNDAYTAITAEQKATVSECMLVKGSTAPDHYIPYQKGVGEQRVDGYYIPLTVSQTGQPDKNVDIFIGDSPLTEGETVSKQSTGVDLELFEGENTVSTTLYNKPEMTIKYKWR